MTSDSPRSGAEPGAPITVVIVDDHLLMATTVATALATKPDITVLGVVDGCVSGLAAVAEHRPDVLLLDQSLPDGLGTDILPALLAECPQMKVLVVTGVAGDDVVVAAMEGGAVGVILKGYRFDVLVQAVRDAAHDETVIAPEVLRRLAARLVHPAGAPNADLTGREREVMGLLVEGSSVGEIAEALGIAKTTARGHVRSVTAKLGGQRAARGDRRGVARAHRPNAAITDMTSAPTSTATSAVSSAPSGAVTSADAPSSSPAVALSPPSSEVPCTVFVCDDQKELRNAIGKVLDRLPNFQLVGEAGDGAACLARLPNTHPDILILDVNMPGGGPRVPRAAKMFDPGLHIVVFSGRTDDRLQQEMLSAGADEYVVKTGRLGPLLDALGRAHDHKTKAG